MCGLCCSFSSCVSLMCCCLYSSCPYSCVSPLGLVDPQSRTGPTRNKVTLGTVGTPLLHPTQSKVTVIKLQRHSSHNCSSSHLSCVLTHTHTQRKHYDQRYTTLCVRGVPGCAPVTHQHSIASVIIYRWWPPSPRLPTTINTTQDPAPPPLRPGAATGTGPTSHNANTQHTHTHARAHIRTQIYTHTYIEAHMHTLMHTHTQSHIQ